MMKLYIRDQERGGWLFRYGVAAAFFSFLLRFAFNRFVNKQWISAPFFPQFFIAYLAVQMFLGAIVIISLLKATGKFGYIYLIIVGALVALGILILDFLGKL